MFSFFWFCFYGIFFLVFCSGFLFVLFLLALLCVWRVAGEIGCGQSPYCNVCVNLIELESFVLAEIGFKPN